MYRLTIYLLAAIGFAVSSAAPAAAEFFDDYEYDLHIRELLADDGINFDELAFLQARADNWADTALEAAKAVVPYAANHVNLPNSKANLALGIAGKIIEKTPTSQQIASQRARQQMPSGAQRLREAAQQVMQQQKSEKAANQAKLDSVSNASKESANNMRNSNAGKSQQSSAHPVQDAIKAKPAVPAKSSALSNLKFPQSSSGGSGSSSGKSGLQRSNSMPAQSSKEPTPKLQRSNSAPAKPPVPAKPKALKGKKSKRDELLQKRMIEYLMEEGDFWWL